MAHMDRIRMGDIHGVHAIRFQARVRAPDLVLPLAGARRDSLGVL